MKSSITNLSLKRRVWIAVALVSLMPLIVLAYHFYGFYISNWATLILAVVIVLGWGVIFDVFSSVVKIYTQSKNKLKDLGEEPPVIPNEVQSLEAVINLLSDKVRGGFEQLKDFTKQTEELNREVTKKVLILSAILQANDLFSREAPAEEVIKFLSNHLTKLLEGEIYFCSLRENSMGKIKTVASSGIDSAMIKKFVDLHDKDLSSLGKVVLVDKENQPKNYMEWAGLLGAKNLVACPVVSNGKAIGVVGVGNNKGDYIFSKDDLDVLNLFSQNVTLIWEHERLSSKIEELEILDYLTGLYNEKTILKRLDEEISRATLYQRPCGFIQVSIANYDDYQKEFGLIETEKMLKKMAKVFKKALRTVDISGRVSPAALGAVLIEKNKRQCQEVIGVLKKDLGQLCSPKMSLGFSIAESPVDGVNAGELVKFANNNINS
ncbi:MAG: diguanylate cyclase [Candidatus Omnitrophica bacterium]|nr:diguanylate cyclase [Candidatus Omnitrophota bacterium]MDD5429976.1 diguanylate cyclase [Candidatus Omnitrophota bacterium]